MDMTYVTMVQNRFESKRYSEYCKAKRTRQIHRRVAVVVTTVMLAVTSVAFIPKSTVSADVETEVQEYIVRYGRAWNWGHEIQMNDDRSIIHIDDAPELTEGTDVRVLFNTHGTVDASDDTVIDVTEL